LEQGRLENMKKDAEEEQARRQKQFEIMSFNKHKLRNPDIQHAMHKPY
jgi:hypothetical protein